MEHPGASFPDSPDQDPETATDDGRDDIKLKLLEPDKLRSTQAPEKALQLVHPPDEIQSGSSQPLPDQVHDTQHTSVTRTWLAIYIFELYH